MPSWKSLLKSKPDVVSFDVTSAYLQASIETSDAEYYVTCRDEELLAAIWRITGWKWPKENGQPYFRLRKALYGHPLAGDFCSWEFRTMLEYVG